MSSAGPAYEIRFRDDEHVQIIDLTRNGTAPESRPLPSLYRQSCLLRRESVLLSHSTSESTFSNYAAKDSMNEVLMDEDIQVSSLAVSKENGDPTPIASKPIAIHNPAKSGETKPLAKSAPHRRITSNNYNPDYENTSFSWTSRPSKNLDVIPTVARRLAEEEALDSLRRQEGEDAMRKAQERKAKIAAARQHARKRSEGASEYVVVNDTPKQDRAPYPTQWMSANLPKIGSVANEIAVETDFSEHDISQDNETVDIQKAVDSYRSKKDMYNADDKSPRLDSQPNVYPYKPTQNVEAYIRQPPKEHPNEMQFKDRLSSLNTHVVSSKHEYELSRVHEGHFQYPTKPSSNKEEQSQQFPEENHNCCCIIS